MPQASFGGTYLHPGLAEMAAACLFHILQNHPFVDGNKRTGAAASRVFVLLNGATFDPPNKDFEAMVLSVADGSAGTEKAAAFFREHVKP